MQPFASAIEATLAAHPEQVAAWLANRPGAWGYLAGQAVLVARREQDRRLSEPERRRVWELLWGRLLALREDDSTA